MVAVPVLLAVWLGRRARAQGKPAWLMPAAIALAAAAGVLAVMATFYESTWSPAPELTLQLPAGYSQPWVYVLEDTAAGSVLPWTGTDLPFSTKRATLRVPPSGVVRLKDLGPMLGRVITVKGFAPFSGMGQMGRPGPKALNAGVLMGFSVREPMAGEVDPTVLEDDALVAFISRLETRR